MKLITQAELSNRTEEELRFLFGIVNQTLIRSRAGSFNRSNALASLENISLALGHKQLLSSSLQIF
jgi:hypothetical protein